MQIYLGRFFIKEASKSLRREENPIIPNLDFKSAKRYHGMIVYKFYQSNFFFEIKNIINYIWKNIFPINIGIFLGFILTFFFLKKEIRRKASFELELKGDKKGE